MKKYTKFAIILAGKTFEFTEAEFDDLKKVLSLFPERVVFVGQPYPVPVPYPVPSPIYPTYPWQPCSPPYIITCGGGLGNIGNQLPVNIS